MNTTIWVVQILLAVAFALAGLMKITQPRQKMAERMGWVEDFSAGTIKVIGVVELLGAFGLVLPALTGIFPWLTPLAAAGLVLTMIGAMLTHLRRHEYPMLGANLFLLALAAVVIYGRFVAVPL